VLKRFLADQRGYSVADAVTGLVLLALTIVSLYQVMIPSFALWRNSDERIARQRDVRLAIDRMARALHESSSAFGLLRAYNCNPFGSNQNCLAIGFVTARTSNCTGPFQAPPPAGVPIWQAVIYMVTAPDPTDPTQIQLRQYCDSSAVPPVGPAVSLPDLSSIPCPSLTPPTTCTVIGRRLSQVSFTLCSPCMGTGGNRTAVAISLEEQAATASRPTYRYQTSFYNQTIFLPMNQ